MFLLNSSLVRENTSLYVFYILCIFQGGEELDLLNPRSQALFLHLLPLNTSIFLGEESKEEKTISTPFEHIICFIYNKDAFIVLFFYHDDIDMICWCRITGEYTDPKTWIHMWAWAVILVAINYGIFNSIFAIYKIKVGKGDILERRFDEDSTECFLDDARK